MLSSAHYFGECLSHKDLDELNIEIIRNTLYKVGKLYLKWIVLNHKNHS